MYWKTIKHSVRAVIGNIPVPSYGYSFTYVTGTVEYKKRVIGIKRKEFGVKVGILLYKSGIVWKLDRYREDKVTDIYYNIVSPYYII